MREHNSRRTETNERRLEGIKAAVPLTTDRAVINASVVMVEALASQMKTTLAAVKEFDRKIEELVRCGNTGKSISLIDATLRFESRFDGIIFIKRTISLQPIYAGKSSSVLFKNARTFPQESTCALALASGVPPSARCPACVDFVVGI